MITVLTVNFRSNEFTDLLIDTVKKTTNHPDCIRENLSGVASYPTDTKIVVVDNSERKYQDSQCIDALTGIQCRPYGFVDALNVSRWNEQDRTHGAGLNAGLEAVDTDYVLILDSDCHILSVWWQWEFFNALKGHHIVTVPGSESKPIRPACVFMRTEDARKYDWSATPGYKGHRITPDGFDVGIRAYHQMVAEGRKIKWMDIIKPSRYGTLNGEEYALNEEPICYHHWHGTHLKERAYDYPDHDLIADKQKLFQQVKKKPLML